MAMIGEVNKHFALGEPLRITSRRRWWDILAWRLAYWAEVQLERRAYAEAREAQERGRPSDWNR